MWGWIWQEQCTAKTSFVSNCYIQNGPGDDRLNKVTWGGQCDIAGTLFRVCTEDCKYQSRPFPGQFSIFPLNVLKFNESMNKDKSIYWRNGAQKHMTSKLLNFEYFRNRFFNLTLSKNTRRYWKDNTQCIIWVLSSVFLFSGTFPGHVSKFDFSSTFLGLVFFFQKFKDFSKIFQDVWERAKKSEHWHSSKKNMQLFCLNMPIISQISRGR